MDEAGGEPLGGEGGDRADDPVEEGRDRVGVGGGVGPVVGDGMVDEAAQGRRVAERGEALEAADADVGVREADENGGAGRRRLVAAGERLAGLDEGEGLGGVDPERLEHLGGEDLADAALEGETAVGRAAPGRGAGPLGAEVEQAPVDEVARLGEEEAAAVAEVGVVHAELVAVVAQRQRLGEAAGKRREAAEMVEPVGVGEGVEADPRGPAPVAEAQARLGKVGGPDDVEEGVAEPGVDGLGPKARRYVIRHGREG